MTWAEFPWGKQLYLLYRIESGLNEVVCPHLTDKETETQLG